MTMRNEQVSKRRAAALLAAVAFGAGACGAPDIYDKSTGAPAGGGTSGAGGARAGSAGADNAPAGSGAGDFTLTGGAMPATSGPRPGSRDPDEARNCGVTMHALERLPPEMVVVLDRSGSMVENKAAGPACLTRTCGTRWQEVVSALKATLEKTEALVRWGLKLYPDDDWCAVHDGLNVPVADKNAAAILSRIAARPPVAEKTHTPTREGVRKAFAAIKAMTTPNPKYMLLATDGEPNCMPGADGSNDAVASIQAVGDTAMGGVPVFVVGVATAPRPGSKPEKAHLTLTDMAMQGGRPREATADARYYSVGTSEELVNALSQIAGEIASCTFSLGAPPPVPNNVAVRLDGTKVPRDTSRTNGWDYGPDMKSIQIFGEYCKQVQAGNVKSLQAAFGCPDRVVD
jgi:hypothetical protein